MTTLTNRVRRMLVFLLSHDEFCQAAGQCACSKTEGSNARLVPTSLTLPALATTDASDAVLSVAEVQRAIRQGAVTATTETKTAAEEAAPEPPERPLKKRGRE